MEELLLDILEALRAKGAQGAHPLTNAQLSRIVRRHNEGRGGTGQPRPFAKKHVLPYYLRVRDEQPGHWEGWGVDEELERALVQTLRMKPGRTASGVATVTVLTKPWPCSGACRYCPNDVRMPKSYLADEPACQRAERAWFDPYLQLSARLRALTEMGHVTDKVELIVLGGTWDDYPDEYRTWFVCRLFEALNDDEGTRRDAVRRLHDLYQGHGAPNDPDELASLAASTQRAVNEGALSYNQAVRKLYDASPAWQALSTLQTADGEELERAQRENEAASHRCVGLVVETRPDAISPRSLLRLRRLGCTKVQMGIQSLSPAVLRESGRVAGREQVRRAFELLRLFGFKTHVHVMVNLPGATPQGDVEDYRELVEDSAFGPDEVKLYPCVLVEGAELRRTGGWRPYTDEELMEVLVADVLATPPYTRISRMIRDISSDDILAGNKTTNLRQAVDARIEELGAPVREMRSREIRDAAVDPGDLRLSTVEHATSSGQELFMQWTTPDDRLAGFLRLSLPDADRVRAWGEGLPVAPGQAMIREVHVYGLVAGLSQGAQNGQHLGLGQALVQAACDAARERGYAAVNVISAVGTRAYYRRLGFQDAGLYQRKTLA